MIVWPHCWGRLPGEAENSDRELAVEHSFFLYNDGQEQNGEREKREEKKSERERKQGPSIFFKGTPPVT